MLWRSAGTRITVLAVAMALAWTAFVVRLHIDGSSGPIDRFEEVCLDLRSVLASRRSPPAGVVLLAIDDETVRQAGAYPLPRAFLARIVEAVARQKPRAIALDLLFLDPGPSEADATLADALRSAPVTIAAAGLFNDDGSNETRSPASNLASIPMPTRLLWPIEPMAGAAEVGLVNVSTGFGGIPRHVPLLFHGPTGLVPSLVLSVVALATGQSPKFSSDAVDFGSRRVPLDLGQQLPLRYYGPVGTIPSVTGSAVLGPHPPDLSGRVVVIGATAVGSGDTFPTPFSSVVPGAEVVATAIDNLLTDDGLVRTPWTRWLDAAAATVLSIAAIALIAMRRGVIGLVLVLLLAVAWALVTLLAFGHGYWLSTAVPIVAMTPVAVLYGAGRLWQERRTARRLGEVERGLRPFHSRPLSDRLSKDPAFLSEPLLQDVAILFVDLTGYTTLSETVELLRMRDLLKGFHALVDEVVDQHGGLVVTFMGDGAMIMFGFPESRSDDAARALGAVAELKARLEQWGRTNSAGLERPIEARIAAHFGTVIISRLGGDSHQQITATGDTVNVTSRLLEVAKTNDVRVVVTDCIVQVAGVEALAEPYGDPIEVPIRGRTHGVLVRLGRRKST